MRGGGSDSRLVVRDASSVSQGQAKQNNIPAKWKHAHTGIETMTQEKEFPDSSSQPKTRTKDADSRHVKSDRGPGSPHVDVSRGLRVTVQVVKDAPVPGLTLTFGLNEGVLNRYTLGDARSFLFLR